MANDKKAPVDYAVGYAQHHNMRVFPLHTVRDGLCTCGNSACPSAGKHPRTKNGVKDATTDPEQIRRWWEQWPDANVAIATGNGLYVIDVDTVKGASLSDLEPYGLSDMVHSLIARTGSGGYHLYVTCDEPLPNTANKLSLYIDTRGEGGYVVAPPSRNKDGQYTWSNVRPIQAMPASLLARLKELEGTTAQQAGARREEVNHELSRDAQAGTAQNPASPANAQSADAASPAAQKSAPKEDRNVFLTSVAGTLRNAGIAASGVCKALLVINEDRYGDGKHPKGPLPVEELERTTFKSVVKWEEKGKLLASNLPVVDELINLMNSEIPEPVWIVPELLPEGLTIIGGKTKAGKSWMMLALALICAAGEGQFLSRYSLNGGRVLYLALEDHARRFQDHVNILLKGQPVPSRFGYSLRWNPLTAGGLYQLEACLVKDPDIKLIVIDTLAKVRLPGSSKGNLYLEEYQLMGQLQSLALEYHVALVVIHHVRKMKGEDPFDELSGSTGLAAPADTMMVLDRKRGHDDAILHMTGRDIEEQHLAILFSKQDCTWTCTGSVAERQVSQSKQEILDLLEGNEAMSPKEIAEALEKPQSSIRKTLLRMAQEGQVVKSERGRYALSEAQRLKRAEKGETTLWDSSDKGTQEWADSDLED